MTTATDDRRLLDQLAEQARHWQDIEDLREHMAELRARQNQRNQHQEQSMADRIFAPFTEQQVAALNACQRSGVMHPFTCGGEHELHQTLVAEADGWRCPDEACDYRQTWAHAFMAQPTAVMPPPWPQPPDSPMAAELKRTRQQLRATEDDLAKTRQELTAALLRIQALQVHAAICRVEAAIPAPADPPCGEIILGGKPINAAGSIDTYEEAGA